MPKQFWQLWVNKCESANFSLLQFRMHRSSLQKKQGPVKWHIFWGTRIWAFSISWYKSKSIAAGPRKALSTNDIMALPLKLDQMSFLPWKEQSAFFPLLKRLMETIFRNHSYHHHQPRVAIMCFSPETEQTIIAQAWPHIFFSKGIYSFWVVPSSCSVYMQIVKQSRTLQPRNTVGFYKPIPRHSYHRWESLKLARVLLFLRRVKKPRLGRIMTERSSESSPYNLQWIMPFIYQKSRQQKTGALQWWPCPCLAPTQRAAAASAWGKEEKSWEKAHVTGTQIVSPIIIHLLLSFKRRNGCWPAAWYMWSSKQQQQLKKRRRK